MLEVWYEPFMFKVHKFISEFSVELSTVRLAEQVAERAPVENTSELTKWLAEGGRMLAEFREIFIY